MVVTALEHFIGYVVVACSETGRAPLRLCQNPCDPKVHELDNAVASNKDVRRLDVTVHDHSPRVGVRVVEGITNLPENTSHFMVAQPLSLLVPLSDQLPEVLPLHVLHDQVPAVTLTVHMMEPDDVRVVEDG